MPISLFSSILRHRVTGFLPHLRQFYSATVSAFSNYNPNNVSRRHQQPNKNLLRTKQLTVRKHSSLSPVLSLEDSPSLSVSQAIGTVVVAQANFMRVIVQENADGSRIGAELLCVVKAVLKKIKRRVMVGDKVVVGSVDWVDRRGMIENVFQRKTEIRDPPVANVDHLLVLFAMEHPKCGTVCAH